MDDTPHKYVFAIRTKDPQKDLAKLKDIIDPLWPVTEAKVDTTNIFVLISVQTTIFLSVENHDSIKNLVADAGSLLFSISIIPATA